MRSFAVAAVSALAATATALPALEERTLSNCMSASDAQTVATNFGNLIAFYDEASANATLTTDFTDYSDSVTELINNGCTNGPQPLGSATFTSRANFEAGQGAQPAIPFEQLNLWYSCNQVTLRWRSNQSPQPVTGIISLETTKAPKGSKNKWLINTVYSEFNSGAWMVNLGIVTPTCSA